MTAVEFDITVDEVLAQPYLEYGTPLRYARHWNRSDKTGDLTKAETLLAKLTEKAQFDFALPVWYERAFNLVRQRRPDEALGMLQTIDAKFQGALDEDTWCLWARIYKDRGDVALAGGDLPLAEQEYATAERVYERAYKIRRDRFPGINVATLRFIRASLLKGVAGRAFAAGADSTGIEPSLAGRAETTDLLNSARVLARELVAAKDSWTDRLPDDSIWRVATLAEAYVLLGNWPEAKTAYRAALQKASQPFYAESMRSQLGRICEAYERLGEKCAPPDEFISPAQRTV